MCPIDKEIFEYIVNHSLLESDLKSELPVYPCCLAILTRVKKRCNNIDFTKERTNAVWESFKLNIPGQEGDPDRLRVLMNNIEDIAVAFFKDKNADIHSCSMEINQELTLCTVKFNYTVK